ncbi:putative U-box domain-containing protein 42 [Euphorbia lathyris]|uniref:putative U-box domain-containing protein 42 n=1 Tax=Euphorbia lathyris TaxID=212925 RepID=UPI0033133F24
MESLTDEDTSDKSMDILLSMSSGINEAKDLVNKCHGGNSSNSGCEEKITVKQLQKLIKRMGECLSSIPSSTFQNQEFAKVAMQSLAKEMNHAQFEVRETLELQHKEQECQKSSSKKQQKEHPEQKESDFSSIHVGVSRDTSQVLNSPLLIKFPEKKSIDSPSKYSNRSSRSSSAMPQMLEYAEPLYETFYCPLTKKIMEDPVTIESGVTCERAAITEWFEEFKNSEKIFCPITGKKLMNRVLRANVALKTTIEEWIARNEAAQIKVVRAALSLASSTTMVFEAIRDLQGICTRKKYNKIEVRNTGVLPLLVKFLEYRDRDVRCAALELLCELTEEDDEGKEMLVEMVDISTVIKMLSSGSLLIRQASLLLIHEFSKSQSFCQKIRSVPGGILILIRIKYNQSVDAFSSEKAEEILKNLEAYPENIKHMAENGFLEPLLNHLTEGSEEMQMEMTSYLGEIVIGNDSKAYVAERASPALIQMVHSGNTLSRSSAFKALAQISSYSPNAKILIKSGIIQIMAEEMFARRIYDEPMNSKNEAASILANIFESGIELDNLQANSHGHKITSDYILGNIIYMLNNSTPDELNISLIRILLCLTKSPKSMETIVSVMKQTEARYTLIELINNPHDELGVAAIKLLIELSPHIGYTLVERLCKIRGQPENLLLGHTMPEITERQAVSAKFLAKLPDQNLTLNLALIRKNSVPKILQMIDQIQIHGIRTSRYASAYLEGLVGILVKFTTTLYQPESLSTARNYNLTVLFTELLMKTSSDEVQRLSAIGLENLSLESVHLSVPPRIEKTKSWKRSLPKFQSFGSSNKRKIRICPVHRGVCSSQDTFCLVEANAVKSLLACLDHENSEVVEAAMSAVCTLLDDRVDVDNSVSILSEANAVQHVLNAVKEHKEEGLQQKSFWVIEKFLMKGGDNSASDISQDRLLTATLISAFHHGNGNTRQMAEKILRLLNKMPNFPNSIYKL